MTQVLPPPSTPSTAETKFFVPAPSPIALRRVVGSERQQMSYHSEDNSALPKFVVFYSNRPAKGGANNNSSSGDESDESTPRRTRSPGKQKAQFTRHWLEFVNAQYGQGESLVAMLQCCRREMPTDWKDIPGLQAEDKLSDPRPGPPRLNEQFTFHIPTIAEAVWRVFKMDPALQLRDQQRPVYFRIVIRDAVSQVARYCWPGEEHHFHLRSNGQHLKKFTSLSPTTTTATTSCIGSSSSVAVTTSHMTKAQGGPSSLLKLTEPDPSGCSYLVQDSGSVNHFGYEYQRQFQPLIHVVPGTPSSVGTPEEVEEEGPWPATSQWSLPQGAYQYSAPISGEEAGCLEREMTLHEHLALQQQSAMQPTAAADYEWQHQSNPEVDHYLSLLESSILHSAPPLPVEGY